MSYSDVVSRIAALNALAQRGLAAAAPQRPATAFQIGRVEFGDVLAGALSPSPALPASSPSGAGGFRALAAAQGEVGVSEDPPGSNDGGRIAEYRSAVAGASPGAPWCGYFVSWAAAQAGVPLGELGQGFGSVEEIAAWASRTGRLLPAGSTPGPGDLILFGGRHVGIVESVNPDASLTTIEGNESDAVKRVQRAAAEATGFVRL